jgi:signal transduction histidine kinase
MRWSRAVDAPDARESAGVDDFDARSAMDALGDAIAVVGRDWRVRYVNAPWERIFAVPRDHAVGSDLWAVFPALGVEPGGAMIRATATDGSTRRFDLEYWSGGDQRSYGIRVARDTNDCVIIALSRSFQTLRSARDRDLDERNQENAALRALARQTAAVADTEALLEILCDAASAQCGGHGATVISAGEREAELTSAVGILAPARGRRFPVEGSMTREVLETGQVGMIEDLRSSGRPVVSHLNDLDIGPMLVAPLAAHGHVLGVLAVARDLRSLSFTTRDAQRLAVVADHAALALWKSQLIEQAQEADRAKGRFLATMSHELRTPLTALAGYEELLVDAVLGPLSASQHEVLDRMHVVTEHLSAIIEEVLAYTNIETGREVVRPTELLAGDLLFAVAAVVQPLAEQKRLTLATACESTPIRMTTDVDKARQILVNLAGNAIKFTDQGEVRLAVTSQGGDVRFEVRDSGIGIAEADVERLFRPFTQLDSSLTRKHGGTGLGLYISQRFARLLGGRIDVTSRVGEGSTFTLVLPVQ